MIGQCRGEQIIYLRDTDYFAITDFSLGKRSVILHKEAWFRLHMSRTLNAAKHI